MICKNCGKEIADGAPKCPNCGAPAASEEHVMYNGLKRAALMPIVIICILAFTVMVPWQLIFFNAGQTPGDILESTLREGLEEDMLMTDEDYYGYSYSYDSTPYYFYNELDYIDQLYDMADVEPSDVDTVFKTLMVFFALVQGISAIGLWVDFYKAQSGERLSGTGLRVAQICQLISMAFGLIALIVLIVNTSMISSAAEKFTGYSRAENAVGSACGGVIFLLVVAGILLMVITALTCSNLKRMSDSMETLLPEELSKNLSWICFVTAAIVLIAGMVEGDFLTVLLPAGAFVVYGVTVLKLREELLELSNTRTAMVMATRHSKKI